MATGARPDSTGGIFVNYRNGPNTVTVSALTAWLRRHFGADQVFRDVQMHPGTRYPDELRERLRSCAVLVAVIHDGWLAELDRRRDDDDLDWVRYEIATAVADGKPIVPVLLGRTPPPTERQLSPHGIAELAQRQVARVGEGDFDADVGQLARLLERYVVPDHHRAPRRARADRPKRVGRRVLAWAAGLFVITPILFYENASLWRVFAFPAFASAVVLTTLSVLLMLVLPLGKRLDHRWGKETAGISLRETMRRRWVVPVLGVLPLAYLLSEFGTQRDGEWQKWEVWYLVVLVVVLLAAVHHVWRRHDSRDRTWPPPVSTEPVVFRRAAHRLHEKLTTEPEWRGNRSLARQREAVSVYLDLAETRLKLGERAAATFAEWIRRGHVGDTAAYLGWTTSVLALDAVALVALIGAGGGTLGAYVVVVGSGVAAVVATGAKTLVEFRVDRGEVNRWIDELTEWQARLGPLVFCPGERAATG